jgi:hypothetical protein
VVGRQLLAELDRRERLLRHDRHRRQGQLAGQGWAVGATWSSEMGVNSTTAAHVAVDLGNGTTIERNDVAGAWVTCVR